MSMNYGKKEIYSLLEAKGIAFEKLEHEAVYTMEDMDKAGITAKGTVCKNLFLRDAKGKNHFLVTVPEEKQVDLKLLAEIIGSTKLSFASADRLAKYLCVEQGCVSPFGAVDKVQDKEAQRPGNCSKSAKKRPNGVKKQLVSSFLGLMRSLRGGSDLPLPLSLVVKGISSYALASEPQMCLHTKSAACGAPLRTPARFAWRNSSLLRGGNNCALPFARAVCSSYTVPV